MVDAVDHEATIDVGRRRGQEFPTVGTEELLAVLEHDRLQAASEGGVLLCAPLVIALSLFVRHGWARTAGDASGMYWIRAGALAGLAGAAAQSLWETGLITPANAALACVLCAIVLHEPRRH